MVMRYCELDAIWFEQIDKLFADLERAGSISGELELWRASG